MAEVLPLDLPGSRASTSTPLLDVARKLAEQFTGSTDPGDQVLVVMIEQLATTIDAAARTGRASAAAMAARELREAIKHLQDRATLDDPDSPEAGFADFRDYMTGLVDSSST